MNDLNESIFGQKWLHSFSLPTGESLVGCCGEEVEDFNRARKDLLYSVLNPRYQDSWQQTSVVDMSCKQGYFALPLAANGARVTGIDASKDHVNAANLMAKALNLDEKFKARRSTIEDIMPEKYGRSDVVLMMGLVYHLENPVAAIRTAYSICKDTCVIETHLLSGQELIDEPQVMVVNCVDEPKGFEEIQSKDLCLVPNKFALLKIMEAVGFKNLQVIELSKSHAEYNRLKKRVMVVGYK